MLINANKGSSDTMSTSHSLFHGQKRCFNLPTGNAVPAVTRPVAPRHTILSITVFDIADDDYDDFIEDGSPIPNPAEDDDNDNDDADVKDDCRDATDGDTTSEYEVEEDEVAKGEDILNGEG